MVHERVIGEGEAARDECVVVYVGWFCFDWAVDEAREEQGVCERRDAVEMR